MPRTADDPPDEVPVPDQFITSMEKPEATNRGTARCLPNRAETGEQPSYLTRTAGPGKIIAPMEGDAS
jgi:hypothetical protein